MKINDDHMYHGAALTQIAEHERFTSINAVRKSNRLSRSAFRVNETIGVYLKYANKPVGKDYNFTFTKDNKAELENLQEICESVFIAMACIKDRQICCVSLIDLEAWFSKRESALGETEDTSTILIHLPQGKSFRLNMNQPGRRKIYLAKSQLVNRKQFPEVLFSA